MIPVSNKLKQTFIRNEILDAVNTTDAILIGQAGIASDLYCKDVINVYCPEAFDEEDEKEPE